MDSNPGTRKWTDIRGLAVVALDTGIKVGIVEDFYFEPASDSVRSLRVKTGLLGYKSLPSNAISSIGRDAITTANEEMVIDESHDGRLSELPLGHHLLSYKVMSESGNVVGTVGNILLNTHPPVALRVASFELSANLGQRLTQRYQTFYAHEVIRYGQDVIVILDQVARKLS